MKIFLGSYDGLVRPTALFLIGIGTGIIGFNLTGASKFAWLQIPHQTSALIGVAAVFECGREVYQGNADFYVYLLASAGLFLIISWRYCAKRNVYKA